MPSSINTWQGHRPKAGPAGCSTNWIGRNSFWWFAQKRITAASVATKNQAKAKGRTGKEISLRRRCTTPKVGARNSCRSFFASQDEQFIPEPVSGHTHYLVDSQNNYGNL
jgi:hypothetical protein